MVGERKAFLSGIGGGPDDKPVELGVLLAGAGPVGDVTLLDEMFNGLGGPVTDVFLSGSGGTFEAPGPIDVDDRCTARGDFLGSCCGTFVGVKWSSMIV